MFSIFVALLFLEYATCNLASIIGSIELEETFIKTYINAFQENWNFHTNYAFNEVSSSLNLICGETDEMKRKREINFHVEIIRELLSKRAMAKCLPNNVSNKTSEDRDVFSDSDFSDDFSDSEKLVIFNAVSGDVEKYLRQFLPECIRAEMVLRRDDPYYKIPIYIDLLSTNFTNNRLLLAAYGPNENSYFILKIEPPSVWKLESFVRVNVVGYIDENTLKLIDTNETYPFPKIRKYKPRTRRGDYLKSVNSNINYREINSLEKDWIRITRKMLSGNTEGERPEISSIAPFMAEERGVIYRYSEELDGKLKSREILELMMLRTFSKYEKRERKIRINVSNKICGSADATIKNVNVRQHVQNVRYLINNIVETEFENNFDKFFNRNDNLLNFVPRTNRNYGYKGPSCGRVRLTTSSIDENIDTAFHVEALFVKIGEMPLHNILLLILPGKGNSYFILRSKVKQAYYSSDYNLGDEVKVVGFMNPDEYEESNNKELTPKMGDEKYEKERETCDNSDEMFEESSNWSKKSDEHHVERNGNSLESDENHEVSNGKSLESYENHEASNGKLVKSNENHVACIGKLVESDETHEASNGKLVESDETHEASNGKLVESDRDSEETSRKAEKMNTKKYDILLITEENIELIRNRKKYLTSATRDEQSGKDTFGSNSKNFVRNSRLLNNILLKPVYRRRMKSFSPKVVLVHSVKPLS